MNAKSWITLACTLFVAAPTLPAWQKSNFPVEFMVTDGYGGTISSEVIISIYKLGGLASAMYLRYPERRSTELPNGDYVFAIEAQGFWTTAHEFRVQDKPLFVTVPLNLAPVEGTPRPSRLEGKVNTPGISSPSWVTLIGVLNGLRQTAKLDSTGAFFLEELPPGKYVLLLLNRGQLVKTQTVDVRAFDDKIVVN